MKNHITLTAFTFCMTASCLAQSDEYVRVVCWSDPDFDEVYELCLPPEDENIFKDVSIGERYTVAIRPDGTITHWGDCGSNTCYAPKGVFTKLYAGEYFGYAQDEDGRLTSFGTVTGLTLDSVDANFADVEITRFGQSLGLTDSGDLWVADEFGGCPLDVIASGVSQFAVYGDRFVLTLEGETWNTYGIGESCGNNNWSDILNFANNNYPDTAGLKIYSNQNAIFFLDAAGVLRAWCPNGVDQNCYDMPANVIFESFHSDAWANEVSGLRPNGDIVVLGGGQNWGTPDIEPLSVQVSRYHAIALVSTDQPVTFCSTDSNKDGVVDFQDLIELLSSWGPCSG